MSGYDGSVVFNTKIDSAGMESGVRGLKGSLGSSFAAIRDIMMGPVAAVKEVGAKLRQLKAQMDALEDTWAVQEEATAILGATLKATGANAWTSAEEIQAMATEFQGLTKYGDETTLAMTNVLLGFKNIKGDNFKKASLEVLNMATVMKMDLTSAAQVVGKALDDPVNGINSMARQGFRFTEEQKKMNAELVAAGRLEEAQAMILDELATTYGGAAEAAGQTGTAIKVRLKNAIGDTNEELGRLISEGFKPFRMWLTSVVQDIGGAIKAYNDLREAMKVKGTEQDTLAAQLVREQAALDKLQARALATQDLGDTYLAEQVAAQEKVVASIKAQVQAEKDAASAKTKADAEAAAQEKDKADKAAEAAKKVADFVAARNALEKEYQDSLAQIDRLESLGAMSSEDAAAKRLSAIEKEVNGLNELYQTDVGNSPRTLALLQARTAQFIALGGSIENLGKKKDAAKSVAELTAKLEKMRDSVGETTDPLQEEVDALVELARAAGVAKGDIEKLIAAYAALKKAQDKADEEGAGTLGDQLRKAFKDLGEEIKANAEDWSDVVGEVYTMVTEGIGSAFETLGEALVTGSADWGDWKKAALDALAQTLRALGYQLLAYVALMTVTFQWGKAAIAAAAAVAAFIAAGVIQAWADAEEAAQAVADALEAAGDELKNNRDLFTKAGNAAKAYAIILTAVINEVADFYGSLQDIGADISTTLIDSLVNGLDNDDFLYAIEQYITKAVIQAAVFTDSFMAEVSQIGTDLAQAIASGASESEIEAIKDRLSSLYSDASALAQAATATVESAFGSYAVGSLRVRGDQVANIHDGEMILPSGIAEEARSSGILIGPAAGMDMAGKGGAGGSLVLNVVGTMDVDGEAIGRIAFRYQDELQAVAYGS